MKRISVTLMALAGAALAQDYDMEARCTFWHCTGEEESWDSVDCWAEDCYVDGSWQCKIYNVNEDMGYFTQWCDTYDIYSRTRRDDWMVTEDCTEANYGCSMSMMDDGYGTLVECEDKNECYMDRSQTVYDSGEGQFYGEFFHEDHDVHMEGWEYSEFQASCTYYECNDDEVNAEMCWVEDCYANSEWSCTIVNVNEDWTYNTLWCDTYAIYERNIASPTDFGLDESCGSSVDYWCEWWQQENNYYAECTTDHECFED